MDPISWDEALVELERLELPPVVRTAFVEPRAVPRVLRAVMRDPGREAFIAATRASLERGQR